MTPLLARFDARADAALERFRGNRAVDRLMTTATHVGEFSTVWHVAGVTRGVVTGRWDQTIALAVGLGTESLAVNQVLKRMFRRPRPTRTGDERFEIRTPLTSSFPSGHASAAAFAAITLVRWDGAKSAPLWVPLAATIAVSRAYVRIHHASDVVGGLVVGAGFAAAARGVYRRFGIS